MQCSVTESIYYIVGSEDELKWQQCSVYLRILYIVLMRRFPEQKLYNVNSRIQSAVDPIYDHLKDRHAYFYFFLVNAKQT